MISSQVGTEARRPREPLRAWRAAGAGGGDGTGTGGSSLGASLPERAAGTAGAVLGSVGLGLGAGAGGLTS